jgi:hypothetical protein
MMSVRTMQDRVVGLMVAVVVATAVALALTATTAVASAQSWKRIAHDEGIVVSSREVEGRPFLEFRGVGLVHANLYQVLAVLDDTPRHCAWQANCAVSRIVRTVDAFTRYLYHRVKSPWPVSDRDVVVLAKIEVNLADRVVWSRFTAKPLAGHPAVSDAVRMPQLEGFYKLEWIDTDNTRVTYQVVADTGGMLPTWLANRASRKLPLGTLQGMRRQVVKMAGKYEAFHKRYNIERGGQIPAQFKADAKP